MANRNGDEVAFLTGVAGLDMSNNLDIDKA